MTTYIESINFKLICLNLLYIPFVSLLTWLDLSLVSMTSLAALLMIDYVTGIIKVHRLNGSIKSYRAVAGLLTKGTILLLVFSLAFMAKGIKVDISSYMTAFVTLLTISETYSIFGNGYVIVSGENIKEFDAVAMVIKRVRTFIEKMLLADRDGE